MKNYIHPAWSPKEVDALNRFQRRAPPSEFTCPKGHYGADRALFATRHGWRCPHCDYTKDFAFAEMLDYSAAPYDCDLLPCDVLLAPATIIRRGCEFHTLLEALSHREDCPAADVVFSGDPMEAITTALAAEKFTITRLRVNGFQWGLMLIPAAGAAVVHVTTPEREYDGTVKGLAVKLTGGLRYVVECIDGVASIHTAAEIGQNEGWLPGG